jgi:hypothetical protein
MLSTTIFAILLMTASPSAKADDKDKKDDETQNQMASGSAEIRAFPFGTLVIDKYEFAAIRKPDGRVLGEFNLHGRNAGNRFKVRGDVECLNVSGNRARVGGVVRHSDFPEGIPVGTQLTWSVTDNGEGRNDSPDTASQLLGNDAAAYCAAGLPYPEFPSERGNIQVRP